MCNKRKDCLRAVCIWWLISNAYVKPNFLDTASCFEVGRRFRGAVLSPSSSPWWWGQYTPMKRRSTSTRLHDDITQKADIFILAAVRNLISRNCYWFQSLSCRAQNDNFCDNSQLQAAIFLEKVDVVASKHAVPFMRLIRVFITARRWIQSTRP
jgi:hypothetical protein